MVHTMVSTDFNERKLRILMKDYISVKDIANFFDCSLSKASQLKSEVINSYDLRKLSSKKRLRTIESKYFIKYFEIDLEHLKGMALLEQELSTKKHLREQVL